MMNDRERRDFNAGLSADVDAWLRGDQTRRSFLTKFAQMGGAAMLPGLGYTASGSEAWAAVADVSKVDLADKSTPLGHAQAAAVKASSEGPTDGSAFRAVQAAQKYRDKGVTLNLTYEAGLQALEPKNFSGPLWQALTGINFNVVELPHPDQYSKPIAEHIANSGAYDVLDIEPAWIPALANGGAIVPIDDYIDKFMNKADLDDYHPLYKSITLYKGKRWGVFDDGDQFALYYRTDIFGDPKLKSAYQAKFGKPLGLPKTWDEYSQVSQFITDQLAPNVYGSAHFRKFGSPGNQYSFLQQFRANGGKFFDADMKAQLTSAAGVTTLEQMIAQNKASLPGNNDLDAVAQWAAWLQGKVAMIFSWPPTGRISSNYAQRDKAINFIPQSSIADKVGYAVRARRQRRDGVRLCAGAGRGFKQRGGGLSVHAVGDRAAALAGAHDAALHAARPLPALDLQVRGISSVVAGRQGLSQHLCECANSARRRHDHAGLAGLCAVHRPDVHGRLGRRGPEGRRCRKLRRNGIRRRSGLASRRKRPPIRSSLRFPAATPITRSRKSARRFTSVDGLSAVQPRARKRRARRTRRAPMRRCSPSTGDLLIHSNPRKCVWLDP